MPSRDKYAPKHINPEKITLNAILKPIAHCNPTDLKIFIEHLQNNPPTDDPDFQAVYRVNVLVAESLSIMMRFIAISLSLSTNEAIKAQAADWWIQ